MSRRDTSNKKETISKRDLDLGPLVQKLEKHRRPAWKPKVKEGDGPLTASKFSGSAWLSEKEEWPACPNCNRPMQLFIQLDLDALPAELKGEHGTGLLQLFYCTGKEPVCESVCGAWEPYSRAMVARVVKPSEKGKEGQPPDLEKRFPAKSIVGWERFDDFPSIEEYEPLGIKTDDKKLDEVVDRAAKGKWKLPGIGDKLGGYPFWIQGMGYPRCRKCGKKMRLLFQLDSEDNIPYIFGKGGIGHVTQCPEHKDIVAFGWACH